MDRFPHEILTWQSLISRFSGIIHLEDAYFEGNETARDLHDYTE